MFISCFSNWVLWEKINHEKRVDVDNKFALIKKYSTYSSTVNLHCKKKKQKQFNIYWYRWSDKRPKNKTKK